jgi:hypothetical protein
MCKAIVEKTPAVVDWKLVYRDPLPRWVSDKGRITLLGDSAHPFLPTSAQGATQAMEDGVTIAVCLKRAGGKDRIPAAVRAYQDIRYVLYYPPKSIMSRSDNVYLDMIVFVRCKRLAKLQEICGIRRIGIRSRRILLPFICLVRTGYSLMMLRSMLKRSLMKLSRSLSSHRYQIIAFIIYT